MRVTEQKRWHVTTWRGTDLVAWQEPMADPFLTHTVTLTFGWKERLRCLFGKQTKITVSIGADTELVNAVMRLYDTGVSIVVAPTESGDSMMA